MEILIAVYRCLYILYIISGAGSGIGRAVCCLLAKEGAKVIAADQNVKAAEETAANLEGYWDANFYLKKISII